MPKWRFWEREHEAAASPAVAPAPRPSSVAPKAHGFQPPPPRDDRSGPALDAAQEERLAQLNQRRDAVLFDVHQAEAASQADNPWRERIALIDEALRAVEQDRGAIDTVPNVAGLPLPKTPIVDVEIGGESPVRVAFRIGEERFVFDEEIDWAERGSQLVQPELMQRSGRAETLIPSSIPNDRRVEVAEHLTGSLFVFAVDLRDRTLNGQALPESPTLADLARPCAECGGWQDWHGVCAECQRRAWRRQELDTEAERLRKEQVREEEERAHLADRLPIARRRLADVERQIAALGG